MKKSICTANMTLICTGLRTYQEWTNQSARRIWHSFAPGYVHTKNEQINLYGKYDTPLELGCLDTKNEQINLYGEYDTHLNWAT